MDDFQNTLRMTFLDEALEVVENLESAFLAWEHDRNDVQTIDRIFRLAHNLKGSSKAVGFMEIGAFTHDLESLMLKIKNREMPVDQAVFDLLLQCNDELSKMVHGQRDGKTIAADAILSENLKAAVEGRASLQSEAPNDPQPEIKGFGVFEEPAKVDSTVSVVQAKDIAPSATERKAVDDNIRVSLHRVDSLVTMIGELVILQTVLSQQRHQVPSPLLQRTIVQLSKITKEIQDTSMSLRMISLKNTFQKMQRIVRDTAKALEKDITLELVGEDTELDKAVVDQLGDPLVHLIRNACDHAIELPEERRQAGKSSTGKIRLSAGHQGGKIQIEISDDGKGLDSEKLREKAVEKGLVRPDQSMTEKECHHLIFAAGFSTKAAVTDLSGRGVGMDVVKTNVEKALKGEVHLATEKGKGTTFRIVLPLTLAIIDAMVVRSGGERYVIPLSQVHESLSAKPKDTHKLSGLGDVLDLRGENLPLYRLSRVLGTQQVNKKESVTTDETAIVVRIGAQPFAVVVDEIVGRQQVVIKRLGAEARAARGIIGGAVLGDGSAALILDLAALTNSRERGKGAAA